VADESNPYAAAQPRGGSPFPPMVTAKPSRSWWQKKRFIIPLGVVAVLVIYGIAAPKHKDPGSLVKVADNPSATTVKASADAATPEQTKAAKPPKASLPDGVYHFGTTATFEDGSTLKAGQPVLFVRDQYAAGGEKQKHHVKVKLTFTNNTKKVFDPALTTESITSGDSEGDSVFQDGLDSPDNKILPGHKVTWWVGYGVKNPKKLELTVNMGFLDYDDVIFTND
jgi:hypothetical protein